MCVNLTMAPHCTSVVHDKDTADAGIIYTTYTPILSLSLPLATTDDAVDASLGEMVKGCMDGRMDASFPRLKSEMAATTNKAVV